MKIWNFEKQELDEGIDPAVCNGIDPDAKKYDAVNISYNRKNGKTVIEYIKKEEGKK